MKDGGQISKEREEEEEEEEEEAHLVARVGLVAGHLVAGRIVAHGVVADSPAVGSIGHGDGALVVLLVRHAHSEGLGGAGQRNTVEGLDGGIGLAGLLVLDKPHTPGGVGGLVREDLDLGDGTVGLEDGLEILLGNVGLEAGDIEVALLLVSSTSLLGNGDPEGLALDLATVQGSDGGVGLILYNIWERKKRVKEARQKGQSRKGQKGIR